jgi:hypothetical protein
MAGFRLPGPVCRLLGALEIDPGTLCRSTSPAPGPLSATKKKNDSKPVPTTGVAHVLKDPETYIGSTDFPNDKGEYQCVAFPQNKKVAGAPHTSKWRPGAHVERGTPIIRGTWVATFVDGKYQGHVGAFDSMDAKGNLTLIDQWEPRGRVDRTTYHVKGQPYTGRISNDPSTYYIVLW